MNKRMFYKKYSYKAYLDENDDTIAQIAIIPTVNAQAYWEDFNTNNNGWKMVAKGPFIVAAPSVTDHINSLPDNEKRECTWYFNPALRGYKGNPRYSFVYLGESDQESQRRLEELFILHVAKLKEYAGRDGNVVCKGGTFQE